MVQLGPFAAPAIIVISVPTFGFSDTARYNVAAGAAAQVVANPRDTVVFVATAAFASPGTPNVSNRIEPISSPDDRWMFFSTIDTQCSPDFYCIYRSAIDGAAAQLLGSLMRPGGLSWQPAPSPGGAKLAFVTSSPSGWIILIFDMATKTIAPVGAVGQNPRWSRVGNQIAFLTHGGGPLMLMNSDGSDQRPLTAPNTHYREQPLTWSPDNRWIVARNDSILDLIDVATGTTIPLVYSGKLWAPSWK